MLKKIDKLRDLATDIESHLEDSEEVIVDVIELLGYAQDFISDIKIEDKEVLEGYLEDAIDQLDDLSSKL